MKRIRIDLYARVLGELRLSPLRRDKETLKILKKAKGVYDTELFYNEPLGPFGPMSYDTIYLADHDTNCITVTDYTKDTQTEYPEKLKELEVNSYALFEPIYNYIFGDEIDYDNPTEENCEKFEKEFGVSIAYYKKLLNTKMENNLSIPELFEYIKNGEYDSHDLFSAYVDSLIKHSNTIEGAECALLHWGTICKGEISYHLTLEDDEEFDINKLHFFNNEDIWEDLGVCCQTDTEMDHWLKEHTVLADFIEYDGRIITRSDFAEIYNGYYSELNDENGKLIDEWLESIDLKNFLKDSE